MDSFLSHFRPPARFLSLSFSLFRFLSLALFCSLYRSFALYFPLSLSFRKSLSLSISFSQNRIFNDVFLKCSKCVFAMDHFQLFGVFSTQKNASQLSDRLTGISLFVALIFLIPLFLTQFTDTNADSSFLYIFFSPNSIYFFLFYNRCCCCFCCYFTSVQPLELCFICKF